MFAIYTQYRYNKCTVNPAPYCYTDWKCINPDNKKYSINMSEKSLFGQSGVIHRCFPLTDEQVKVFKYIDFEGKQQVRYPGKEVNIWSLSCKDATVDGCLRPYGCSPDMCPLYKKGDIYWPACNGSPSSNYYMDPSVYNSLAK